MASLAGTKTFSSSPSQLTDNLFQKIELLESSLEGIHADLFRLEEEAKNVHDEKVTVEKYLDERA